MTAPRHPTPFKLPEGCLATAAWFAAAVVAVSAPFVLIFLAGRP